MDYEPPTPPSAVPDAVLDSLEDCSVAELRALATYAEALAEYRERAERLEEQAEEDDEALDTPRPEGVPTKATLTTKTINDNQYYYWQWREGNSIKSQYIGPVNADE